MTLLQFPAANSMHTANFWTRLEAVYRQMGYDVYCAPSYVQRGFCRPGKHPHGPNSRHFVARALDIGFDPPSGAPESNFEKGFLDVTVRMMRARYPRMFVVWNRGPGDHRDHAHFDDQSGYPMEGRYTGISLPSGITGFGHTGSAVTSLQSNLNEFGKAGLKVDGIFGLATFDALRRYQYAKGLTPDGLAGPATRATFVRKAPPKPKPKPLPSVDHLRVAGKNRYATAAALNAWKPPNGRGVILVADGSPDYKAATSITGRHPNVYVLPVRAGGGLPGDIARLIREIKPAWVRAAGGPTAVPDSTIRDAAAEAKVRI